MTTTTCHITTYGHRITAARDYAGLSRQQVADALDMSENTIGRYERDEYLPRRPVREAIAKACGVPVWFLETGFQPSAPGSPPASWTAKEWAGRHTCP